MGKKIFFVSWIFVFVSFAAVRVFSESFSESAVQISADKLIQISLSLEQGALKLKISASGTPIGGGLVVTNRHVFKNDAELRKKGFDTAAQSIVSELVGYYTESRALRFSLKLQKLGVEDDVAILRANLQTLHDMMENSWSSQQHRDLVVLYALLIKGIPIADKKPAVDDSLYLAGFPFGGPLVVNAGMLFHSSLSDVSCRGNAEYGMSGGGIFNGSGEIVGFVARKRRDSDGKDLVEGPSVNTIEKLIH